MNQKIFHTENVLDSSGNQTLAIPPSFGQGSIKTLHCNSGIQVLVSDFSLLEPTIVTTENTKSCCGFGFCLSGTHETQFPYLKNDIIAQKGQSGFFSFPELETYSTKVYPERVLHVVIYIQPDLIAKLTGKNLDQLPSILTNSWKAPYRTVDTITPSMHATLHHMFNCTYQGPAKELYIEGKVLELLAHKIAQLDSHEKKTSHKKRLTSDEIERVRYAADLLSLDLEQPPNIVDLSGHTGMCRSKLYAGFNEVFGTSPFGYLKQKRMEMAERLLKDGESHVTQVAYAVGYSNLSYFTKAFKKNFGVLPSKYSNIFSSSDSL